MWLWHRVCVATSLALLALADVPAAKRKVTEAEVQNVHRSALLIDTHNDVTSFTIEGFDIGTTGSKHHTDLARLKMGGVGAVFFAAYVGPEFAASRTAAFRALQMIDTIRTDIVARYPNDFVLAQSAADIEEAHKRGRIAALIGSTSAVACSAMPRRKTGGDSLERRDMTRKAR